MFQIFKEKPRFPEVDNLKLHAPATIGDGLITTRLKISKRPEQKWRGAWVGATSVSQRRRVVLLHPRWWRG